jgi:hypothetical protein
VPSEANIAFAPAPVVLLYGEFAAKPKLINPSFLA